MLIFTGSRSRQNLAAFSVLSPSIHYEIPEILLKRFLSRIPKLNMQPLRTSDSIGILTYCPVLVSQLRKQLGPTNSRLINSAEKPLLFRLFSFSENLDPTNARILIPARSILSYERTSAHAERLSTSMSKLDMITVSVVYLAPSIYEAINLDK